MAKQDIILEKSNEILETLKKTHCEHLEWTRATHGITATSYFRWHRDDAVVDQLKVENMEQFFEIRRLLRQSESREPRGNEQSLGLKPKG